VNCRRAVHEPVYCVIDEGLNQRLVHGRPVDVAADRGDVVDECPVHPWTALRQVQRHGGGADTPFALAEHGVAGARRLHDRARAPNPLTGMSRGHKSRELHIADTVGGPVGSPERRLGNDRQDRACDQVPIRIQLDGIHRLNVKNTLLLVERPHTKIKVVLERHTDQVRHRVLSGLGERLLGRGIGLAPRRILQPGVSVNTEQQREPGLPGYGFHRATLARQPRRRHWTKAQAVG
jgi:hypothetical protein